MGRKILYATIGIVILGGIIAALTYFLLISPGDGDHGITEAEFERESKITEEANKTFWDLYEEKGKEKAIDETIDWLEGQEGIEDVEEGKDCFSVKFDGGLEFIIITEKPPMVEYTEQNHVNGGEIP